MEKEKMATVIIPAYNESKTIKNVIETAMKSEYINEILVVDDGSSDDTYNISKNAGAKVIRLEKNKGKAAAMGIGVEKSKNNTIFFTDADLIGFKPIHINLIVGPVIEGLADMNVGIRKRKNFWLNKIIRFFPLIGGERALTKKLWNELPLKYKKNFEIEIALNYQAKKMGLKTSSVLLPGISQVIKEKKRGLVKGLIERFFMIIDIIIISLRLYIGDQFKNILKLNLK